MDNVTHSLVGVALADLAMGRRGGGLPRPLFVGAGIVAANLPDIDVAYSWVTPAPLGYLLHHRGHTHTVTGIAGLALILFCVYWFFPAARKMRLSGRLRFWLLIAIALASHLGLDYLNSYGLHPFYPWNNGWYFGDSVFIVEPALWLILGVAVASNGRTRAAKLAAAVPLIILLATVSSAGIVPRTAVAALAITGGVFVWSALRLNAHTRAAVALALCAAIAGVLAATSRVARAQSVAALEPELRGQVVDVILTPNPSSAVCWGVIVIELRETVGEYVLWRGTLSLAPAWRPPTDCASHRFVGAKAARGLGNGRFVLRDETRQPLARLRSLARNDCWVRAWLRFGRAPVIDRGTIYDLRFAERIGQDFSQLRIMPRDACPANVPGWRMPRADLLREQVQSITSR